MPRPARAVHTAIGLILLICGGRAAAHIEQVFACFVYVEPYELRVEFVTTTTSLGMPLNFGFDGIDAQEQAAIAEEAGRRLAEAFTLHADERLLDFEPVQVGFVRKQEADGPVVADQRKLIPLHEARISGIFVCTSDALPAAVRVNLNLYQGRPYRPPETIPVQIEALASPTRRASIQFDLSADKPERSWRLPAGLARTPLVEVSTPPPPSYAWFYFAGALGLLGLAVFFAPVGGNRPRLVVGGLLLLAGTGVAMTSLQRGLSPPVEDAQARATLEALLTNVYHAFAHRDESKIFDTLASSVDGPLLEALYLDIRRGLSDAENGGPSVRVLGVDLLDCEVQASSAQRIQARVRWVSSGTVSHWGHAHDRRNRYHAAVVAEAIDGRWCLTRVRILEEERVD